MIEKVVDAVMNLMDVNVDDVDPQVLNDALALIGKGDQKELRAPSWMKKATKIVTNPTKFIRYKNRTTLDHAETEAGSISEQTLNPGEPGSELTQHAFMANIIQNAIGFRKLKANGDYKGAMDILMGTPATPATADAEAIGATVGMIGTVDTRLGNYAQLVARLSVNQADIELKKGNYAQAFEIADTPALARNNDALEIRGKVRYEGGMLKDEPDKIGSETYLKQLFDKDPSRKGLGERLAKVYDGLAKDEDIQVLPKDGFEDFTGLEGNVGEAYVNAFADAKQGFVIGPIAQLRRVINGTTVADTDAKKQVRAKAYHKLAELEVRNRNITSAAEYLALSAELIPTVPVRQAQAQTYRLLNK